MTELISRMNQAMPLGYQLAFLIRVLVATLCGGAIGLERTKRLKEAGIRTHCLVCCASALIMIVSKYAFADLSVGDAFFFGDRGADPARIAAQVVSGISFIGLAVIYRNGSTLKGLTTAAGIWATAGIGLAIGAGFYECVLLGFALIFLTTWFQYNGTFFTTYKESGVRRLNLAERLRKLPLSFFGKRDLADLTSTIMADCEVLEKTCSHYIPGLFGSLISTVLIALSLPVFNWRMALAALWVIPVSIAILLGSYKIQDNVQAKTMAVKMACADGIQEYIESIRDLKANSAENAYLDGLSEKIRAVEKQTISAELTNAVFVTSAAMVLKLGIASVALTGSVLLIRGSIDVLTLFLFLLVASRLYDPMQGALQNLAAVISTRTNIARMNEILDHPIQQGDNRLFNKGYAHQCGPDERNSGLPGADRQRGIDQSGLRHGV